MQIKTSGSQNYPLEKTVLIISRVSPEISALSQTVLRFAMIPMLAVRHFLKWTFLMKDQMHTNFSSIFLLYVMHFVSEEFNKKHIKLKCGVCNICATLMGVHKKKITFYILAIRCLICINLYQLICLFSCGLLTALLGLGVRVAV